MKQKKILNKSFFIFVLLILNQYSFSQDDDRLYNHDLDEKKWQSLREGIRYEGTKNGPGRQWTYESNKEYNDAKKKYQQKDGSGSGSEGSGNGTGGSGSGAGNRPKTIDNDQSSRSYNSKPPSLNSPSFNGMGAVGYILMIILIIALIFLIYYMYINTPKKGKKIRSGLVLEDLNPVDIPLTDLERLLKEALDKEDYRAAVRVYFIFILRDLADKSWINWEKEKTNFHYLREMSGKNEFENFNIAVTYFEIIWYGKREIDKVKFEQIKPKFTLFLEKLGVK